MMSASYKGSSFVGACGYGDQPLLGCASRLSGKRPFAGILNGALEKSEPWDMALDIGNYLMESMEEYPMSPS